jgi:hypothetical protein
MNSKGDGDSVNGNTSEAAPEKTGNGGARRRRKKIATRLTLSIAVASIAVAVAVVLVVVFLIMPSPMIGMYITSDGRKLELHGNGTARYGVTYKTVWMAATYRWSRSGDSVKMVLPGTSKAQQGYKIRGKKLFGNGGVWVKR